MQTNFFQQLNSFGISGNILLNIQPDSIGKMIVSVLITNDSIKDKAINHIPPMVLTGSIAELDENFFSAISEPVKKTNELFRNLLDHEKGLKTAIGKNGMQKGKNESDKIKRKLFDEKMKKVDELEKEKKYGQAITQMPDAKAFPEFSNEINKKMTQLRSSHGTLDLFATEDSGTNQENVLDNPSLEEDDPEEGLVDDDNDNDDIPQD